MEFKHVSLTREWYESHEGMLLAAYEEVGDGKVMDPDMEMYRQFRMDPFSVIIELLTDEGECAGFCMMSVTRYPHTDDYYGMNDLIYVKPEFRGLSGGLLVKECERTAEMLGATSFCWRVPADSPFARMLAKPYHGYQLLEKTYRRKLG